MLFENKLAQLLKFRERNASQALSIKIGTSVSTQTFLLALQYNLPLVITVLAEKIIDYHNISQSYSDVAQLSGQEIFPLGLYAMGHIADTDQQALDEYRYGYEKMYNSLAQKNNYQTLTDNKYASLTNTEGSLLVGSAKTVATKIAQLMIMFSANNFQLRYTLPGLTADQRLKSIEIYAQEVIPRVKKILTENKGWGE